MTDHNDAADDEDAHFGERDTRLPPLRGSNAAPQRPAGRLCRAGDRGRSPLQISLFGRKLLPPVDFSSERQKSVLYDIEEVLAWVEGALDDDGV